MLRTVEISKNDILKSDGPGIHLVEVRTALVNDPKRMLIKDNMITEIKKGHGIMIESSTCCIEHNEVKKNELDGIYITSNSSV